MCMAGTSVLKRDSAVSPVVAVMLMLVVTIIIAAIVSAFAGGITSGQKNVPQATIKADFSILDGFKIHHTGGDSIPMNDVQFTIWDGPTFGPNVEQSTKQVLDLRSMIDESANDVVMTEDGVYNTTAFMAGSTLALPASKCTCDVLQPKIAPTDGTISGATYSGGTMTNRWALCIMNTKNIGKDFVLTLSDKNGNLIAKTNVKVTG
jgi:Uncharacterized protein conserved in archaea